MFPFSTGETRAAASTELKASGEVPAKSAAEQWDEWVLADPPGVLEGSR